MNEQHQHEPEDTVEATEAASDAAENPSGAAKDITETAKDPGGVVADISDDSFEAALLRHAIELDPSLAEPLRQYVELMWRFNEQVNLTRHTTWDLFVGRDLRDCLQLAHLLQPDEIILDLGSGNGIPGIPLAILRPDLQVSLAESVGKRAKVLDEIVAELNLSVAVYAARGEDLLEDFRFTTIVSRAVGSLMKFCRWIEPNWSGVDRLLLVKGPRWVQERAEARHYGVLKELDLRVVASYPLGLPAEENDESGCSEPDSSEPVSGELASSEPDSVTCSEEDAATREQSEGQGVILQLSRKGRFA